MKCFLHIGTEKTATKTIQSFLDLNRNELFTRGFLYTKSVGEGNNRLLPIAAYDLARRDDFTKTIGIRKDSELHVIQNRIIGELKKEIDRGASKKPDLQIVFSSEHFQSRLTEKREIVRLQKILHGLGVTDVSVVVYLRNPAEIANSLYSTSIKFNDCVSDFPPPPSDPYYANICNHRMTLEKFASVFGEAAIIPRLFHKTEFKNGSIIEDFLQVLGIPLKNTFTVPDDRNKGISPLGLNILRRINKIIPRFVREKPNPLRGNIISYFEKHFSDSSYVMPGHLFDQYDAEFHESNEWVRNKYFPDRKFLFPALSPRPAETLLDISNEELDKMVDLIAQIWIDKQIQIISLAKKRTA